MFSTHEVKAPPANLIPEASIDKTPPKEWQLQETDKVTDAFYVKGRKILCIDDEKKRYVIKIINDQDVYTVPFPFNIPCKKILEHSKRAFI